MKEHYKLHWWDAEAKQWQVKKFNSYEEAREFKNSFKPDTYHLDKVVVLECKL